ncbi:Glycine betaine transport ATP-binding protein OpuAA [compost metagenome]
MSGDRVDKIVLRRVSKVFGPRPDEALEMLRQGAGKAEVLQATGCVVGILDLSLSVGAGERFVVMGLSGSGKSTLVRHINRLVEPSSGQILVDGENVLGYGPEALREFRRHKVSMVFQGFGLLPHKTVLDNVAYGLRLRGEPKSSCLDGARFWIARVGLEGFEASLPRQLSGGMRQRVGLARALATDTDIILMDEAFSALDPLIRADMQDQLLALHQDLGKTLVFITHDLDEALLIGQRIAMLRDGRLVQVGRPEDILARPADDYVERFVARHRNRFLNPDCSRNGGVEPTPKRNSMHSPTNPSSVAGSQPARTTGESGGRK